MFQGIDRANVSEDFRDRRPGIGGLDEKHFDLSWLSVSDFSTATRSLRIKYRAEEVIKLANVVSSRNVETGECNVEFSDEIG